MSQVEVCFLWVQYHLTCLSPRGHSSMAQQRIPHCCVVNFSKSPPATLPRSGDQPECGRCVTLLCGNVPSRHQLFLSLL